MLIPFFYNMLLFSTSGSVRVPSRTPISNVEVNNIGLAGQACFIQRIVVKTAIKSNVFFTQPNLVLKQNYRSLKRNRLKTFRALGRCCAYPLHISQVYRVHGNVEYNRHFAFVDCDDITNTSSHSFDKFMFELDVSLPLVTKKLLKKTVEATSVMYKLYNIKI